MDKASIIKPILHLLGASAGSAGNMSMEIINTLRDITTRIDCLEGSQDITLVSGTAAYDLTDKIRRMLSVSINQCALERLGFQEYQDISGYTVPYGDTTNIYGKPDMYALWNNQIYFTPTPSAADTVNLKYYKIYDGDLSEADIGLPDNFLGAIAYGVIARLSLGRLKTQEKAPDFYQLYEMEMTKLSGTGSQPACISYRDL